MTIPPAARPPRPPFLRAAPALGATALVLAALLLAGAAPAESEPEVAGQVIGEPVFRDQLQDRELADLRKRVYERETALLRKLSLSLLRTKMPDEFPEPTATVSDEEVAGLYRSANLEKQGSLESLEPRIRAFLEARKLQELDELQYQMAIARGYVESRLVPPEPFMVEISDVERAAATRGSADAPLRIVEFSDFQCPFCNRARPTVERVMAEYAEEVRLVYRHLPLERIHPRARELAEASECAGDQERFWPFYEVVFDHNQTISDEDLNSLAREAKVPDLAAFGACTQSRKYASRVEEDLREAERLNIGGTPTFLIGRPSGKGRLKGILISGAQPFSAFEEAIAQIKGAGID